jgi:hypothetical protein
MKKPIHDHLLERLVDEGVDLILFGCDVLSPYTDMEYMKSYFPNLPE